MSQKTQTIIAIGIAIAFFVLGYTFSFFVKVGPTSGNTFQAGWDAAKARLAESGFASPMGIASMEVKNINGTIQEINGNKITLKIRPLEPLADASLDTRIVIVDSATKIYVLEQKSPKEYASEMDAYNKKLKTASPTGDMVLPPDIFKKNEISISDLKTGDMINITAAKDIKEVKEFNAVEITLNKPAAAIAAPAAPIAAPVANNSIYRRPTSID